MRGSKIGQKASQNGPKWLQNASKIGSEGPLGPMRESEPNKGPKKVNSGGLRGSILEPKMVQNRTKSFPKRSKMAPQYCQNGVRGPSGTHAGIRAEQGAEKSQLRGTLGLHFGAQNGLKSLQKRIQKKERKTTSKKEASGSILDHFRRIFRGFLVPKRSRRRPRIDFNEKKRHVAHT